MFAVSERIREQIHVKSDLRRVACCACSYVPKYHNNSKLAFRLRAFRLAFVYVKLSFGKFVQSNRCRKKRLNRVYSLSIDYQDFIYQSPCL